MVDKKKINRLLDDTVRNFSKLIKIYAKLCIKYHKYTIIDKKDEDATDTYSRYIEKIEDELSEYPKFGKYLLLNKEIKKKINNAANKKITPTLDTLMKIVKVVEKKKMNPDVMVITDTKIIVYVPVDAVSVWNINPDGSSSVQVISESPNGSRNSYSNGFGGLDSPVDTVVYNIPSTITGPGGPGSPGSPDGLGGHGSLGPTGPYGTSGPYFPHISSGHTDYTYVKYLIEGSRVDTALKLSPAQRYTDLLRYLSNVILLPNNRNFFGIHGSISVYNITYSHIIEMYNYAGHYYLYDASYDAKIDLLDYAIYTIRDLVESMLKLDPYGNYNRPDISLYEILAPAQRHTEIEYVSMISRMVNDTGTGKPDFRKQVNKHVKNFNRYAKYKKLYDGIKNK